MRNTEGAIRNSTCGLSELLDFRDLPEAVRTQLRPICRLRSFSAGQTVMEIGARPDAIGIVRDGILRMQKSLPDGRQHVVGLLVKGDLFGRVFDGGMNFAVEAATDAEVFSFDKGRFDGIVQRSAELDRILLVNLMNELDRARDWMIILAHPKIRGRLAGFLLLLCTRFQRIDHLITIKNRAVRIHIPLTRPDVANLLGTRVESVSRALHALAADGLVRILQPDLVEIEEIEALTEEAGESDMGDPASLERLVRLIQKAPD